MPNELEQLVKLILTNRADKAVHARNCRTMANTNETKLSATGKIRLESNGAYAREFGKLIMEVPEGIASFEFNKETGEVVATERKAYQVSQYSLQRQLKDIVPGYAEKIDEYRGIKDDAVRTRKYNNLFILLTKGVEFEITATPYHAGDVYVDENGEECLYRYDGYRYTVVNGKFPEAVLAKISPISYEDMLADI